MVCKFVFFEVVNYRYLDIPGMDPAEAKRRG